MNDGIEDFRQKVEAADNGRAFLQLGRHIVADVQADRKDQTGSGAAAQRTCYDDARSLLCLGTGQFVQFLNSAVERFQITVFDCCVEGKTGDGADLSGTFRQRLRIQDRIDREPGISCLGIDAEILSDSQFLRDLDRPDLRHAFPDQIQFIDIGVKDDKADILSLFRSRSLEYFLNDGGTGTSESYE